MSRGFGSAKTALVMLSLGDRIKVSAVRNSSRLSRIARFSVTRRHAGTSIVVPITSGQGLNLLDTVDADLSVTLRAILQFRKGPVVDIGANVGLFLMALLEINRAVPYVAFEPDISCCDYLDILIRANNLSSHSVFPIALSDKPDVLTLHYNATADVSATVMQGFRPANMYDREKKVLSLLGDDVLKVLFDPSSSRISVIKIDVEGAENAVLRGLACTIERHRPFLIIEISPYQHFLEGTLDKSYFGDVPREEALNIARWRQEFIREVDAFLSANNYLPFKIRESGALVEVQSVDPGVQTSFRELNYLAVPREEGEPFKRSAGIA